MYILLSVIKSEGDAKGGLLEECAFVYIRVLIICIYCIKVSKIRVYFQKKNVFFCLLI